METATVDLKTFGTLKEILEWREKQLPTHPTSPKKPILSNKHTAEEVKAYAKELETYENLKVLHIAERNRYNEKESELDALVKEWIMDNLGVYTIVPEQYREKLWSHAWSHGHSGGYSEVCYYLKELVEIFEN